MLGQKWSRREIEDAELNLTAFLDMMVTIIPFLLLTSAFIRLGGVTAQLPVQRSESSATAVSKKLDLSFELKDKTLTIQGYLNSFNEPLADMRVSFPMEQRTEIIDYVTKAIAKYPEFGSSLFYASPESTYDDAVQIVNTLKTVPAVQNIVFAVRSVE